MLFLEISKDDLTLIILAICIIPIALLMIYAIIVALRRSAKRSELRKQEISETTDNSQVELFMDVYGGKENIKEVKLELSRISVQVIDMEKVKVEELKNLGANGVLLVNDVVKCSYGDRAPYIYKILSGSGNSDEHN